MPPASALVSQSRLRLSGSAAVDNLDASDRTRLHITPLNPALLERFIPAAVLPLATAISYHTIDTCPEKGFGYVELPAMEAQKLKKKLNGSILKGVKVRIEDARPEKRKKRREDAMDDTAERDGEKRSSKRAWRSERQEGVLPGVELPKDRRVRRGWTEPVADGKTKKSGDGKKKKEKKKRKAETSKYTKDPELLFRTNLPPNVASAMPAKERKSKDKARKERDHQFVVHEFAKTTKHASFLKSSQVPKSSRTATQYVDGKGWVDDAGSVVEAESELRRKKRKRTPPEASGDADDGATRKESDAVLSAQTGNSGEEAAGGTKSRKTADTHPSASSNSMSGELSGEGTSSTAAGKPAQEYGSEASEERSDEDLEESSSAVSSESSVESSDGEGEGDASSSVPGTEIDDTPPSHLQSTPPLDAAPSQPPAQPANSNPDDPSTPEPPKEVHPLEALFKRPRLPGLNIPVRPDPVDMSFSFFEAEAEDERVATDPPRTPYTRQDVRNRSVRSAAPTPDTAAIGRRFSFPWNGDADVDEEDEEDGEDEEDEEGQDDDAGVEMGLSNDATQEAERAGEGRANAEEGEKQESEFAKWFWENRGESNRAWKRRRREVLKVKRQRENKRLGRRVV